MMAQALFSTLFEVLLLLLAGSAILDYLHHRSPQFLQRGTLCLLTSALIGLIAGPWLNHTYIPLLPVTVILDPITLIPKDTAASSALVLAWQIYIAGVIALTAGWLAALIKILLIHLRARQVTHRGWHLTLSRLTHRRVRLLASSQIQSPMTWGTFWPVILIPERALRWQQNHIEWTLRHEMSHINNADWLSQQISRLSCIIFWPIPCAWHLLHTQCQEAEVAADNCVLASGVDAPDYAAWLLQQAAGMRYRCSVALAPAGRLENRFANLLHPRDEQQKATPNIVWASAVAVGATMIATLEVGTLASPVVPQFGIPIARIAAPKPLPAPGTALIQRLSHPLQGQVIPRPPAPPPVARAPAPLNSAPP
ncbi:M56 family metallopeptidase [Spongiibacter taiwanensis]|uniref:M56 family metallopeptidase n=1 Tax=Spongiibacter taiwanensis TaxID=1748242 RepID=UPI002035D404|nr:M56 family metallopeptidase [Spongiibacter taiwanensis]USA42317.1 M56 family metallopeptidase [Spongiibacter taiwanensis]